jgi:hypothetical protein
LEQSGVDVVTPWQARFFLLGFLLLGSAIAANLLVMQGAKVATGALKQKATPATRVEPASRLRPWSPERRDAKPVAETKPARPDSGKSRIAPGKAPVVPTKAEKSARPSQTTSTR